MENGSDQQSVAGLFPMVAPLKRPFWIHQDVGDVLHIAYLAYRRGAPRAADCRQTKPDWWDRTTARGQSWRAIRRLIANSPP
jgi:hypothetical protein